MTNERKPLGISPWWRHGAVLTVIIGITGLIFMGRTTYTGAPPYFNAVTAEGQTVSPRTTSWPANPFFKNMG
jgi:hypothetical protein